MDFNSDLKNDKKYVLEAVKRIVGCALEHASLRLQNDEDVVLEAVKHHGGNLEHASPRLRNDKVVVLEAVKHSGHSLSYASLELRNNKEVVLEAVKNIGKSLKHVSEELRNDKEVVLEAVKQSGLSLEFASSELRNDKEVVLEAVKDFGKSLRYASLELKNDKDVVLEAVKQFGYSLRVASEELKNDKEVVLEAVKQSGPSLSYASLELRNEKEVVLEAVKQDELSILYASKELQNDKGILFSRKLDPIKVNTFQFDGKYNRGVNEEVKVQSSYEGSFEDLVFLNHIGRGAFGGTYRCFGEIENDKTEEMAVKVYNNLFEGLEKKEELLSRDCLYIPQHENVVTILKHWTNETIDLYKFSDYEEYWKTEAKGKRYIQNCGVILMSYYDTTLKSYLCARMEENERFQISEIRHMFWGLLCGVCHLHKNMIVHRDLHGDNIFVDFTHTRILIGDFGCCLDLRKNKTGFIVHRDHELMFSFSNDSYFKRKDGDRIGGFKKGGYKKLIPPEIQKFDPLKEEFLDYSKNNLRFGEDDFGLSEFMEKLVIEDPVKRLGCLESIEIGKFIELERED